MGGAGVRRRPEERRLAAAVKQQFPLRDTLAERIFSAHHGSSDLTWDHLGEFGRDEYLRQADRVLASLWNPTLPLIVLDHENDTLTLTDIECKERA